MGLPVAYPNLSSGGIIPASVGAVGAPGFTFVGDLDTGFYSPSAGVVALSINGTEAFRVNTSRNFLFGTSTAATGDPRLDVVGTLGLVTSSTTTDATNKIGRVGVRHYTNSEEPMAVYVATSSSTNNSVDIGGGTSLFNAATLITVSTAANNTTTTGTQRWQWDSGGHYLPVANDSYNLGGSSLGIANVFLAKTITAALTTGAQTINKNAGSVNFAAAATSLVVTNSRVTANSIVVATVATADATMLSVTAVPGSGSFTLTANAAATAETRVNWLVIN